MHSSSTNLPDLAWPAPRLLGRAIDPAGLSPAMVDQGWLPLVQAWRPSGPEPGFNPGWARIGWNEGGLGFDAILLGKRPHNLARRLNENTWELGDVCEFFVQIPGAREYLELHVTPENHRLQLVWSEDGLQQVRAGTVALEEFMVTRGDWVRSATFVGPDFWVAQAFLPAGCLGGRPLAPGQTIRAAVCRYDYAARPAFVLSSTARLREPSYHRRDEWHPVVLT